MAEESINSSVTPEITKPKEGSAKRQSTGKANSPNSGQNILPAQRRTSIGPCHSGGNSRRTSIGKTSSSNSGRNIIPNVLRASTGSCHDFCKYGKTHEFEVKPWHSVPKRRTTPSQSPEVTVVVPAERKKTMVVKLKPSTISNTSSPEIPEVIKREIPSLSKKVEVFTKDVSSNDKKVTQSERKMMDKSKKRASSVKPKEGAVKSLSSSDNSGSVNGRRNSEMKIGNGTGTSKPTIQKVLAPISVLPPPKASIRRGLSPKAPSGIVLSPKASIGIVLSLNARKSRSLKLASPLKNQNGIRKAETKKPSDDEVQEKTLHVIKTEPTNKSMESPNSSSHPNSLSLSLSFSSPEEEEEEEMEESVYTDSEEADSVLENDETANTNDAGSSERNKKRISRKAGSAPEDKESEPTKLKFRRGKVVDLQSEYNSPRRLRFRRGRVLGERQENKGNARRSFKKKGTDDDISGIDPGSQKVVLRHQDAKEGKKDAQGLFNNVIEETASKLVEARKSKVKALVGAFETVISLQENPPAHTVT